MTNQGPSYCDSNHPHQLHAKQAYLERNSSLFKHCPHLAKSVVHLKKSFGSNKGELVSRTRSRMASWHTRATESINVFGVPWLAVQENSCDSTSTKRNCKHSSLNRAQPKNCPISLPLLTCYLKTAFIHCGMVYGCFSFALQPCSTDSSLLINTW